jgi:multicomponent Na+:H+ antiporter subunit C
LNGVTLAGLGGATLIGLGLFGLATHPHLLRKIVAFNVMGAGVFLLFGAIARRGAAAGVAADPVPQALIITGIVVAFSATALAVALLLRVVRETGSPFFPSEAESGPADKDGAT